MLLVIAIQTESSCRLSIQCTYSQFSSGAWAVRHYGPAQGKHTSWLVLLSSSMSRYGLEKVVVYNPIYVHSTFASTVFEFGLSYN